MEYKISEKDLRDAENFLVQFQTENVPEANLAEGGAVRDLLIYGFAGMYAFLRGEIDRVAARQSLLRIQNELTEDDDISDAVDEILSNWFVTRKGGQYARMIGRFHFTTKQAQRIDLTTKFWRTSSTVFYIDETEGPYVISETQLLPRFGFSGELLDYVVDVPLIAAKTGEGYNLPPGMFTKVQVLVGSISYLSYVENVEKSSSGTEIESTEEIITRAPTAIATRNLVNNRSCDATLQEEFPEITETLTIGMAEPEMIRDRRIEIAAHLRLHIGGAYDTYVSLPDITVEEQGIVGGNFARPDGIACVFRDPELTYDLGRKFDAIGVKVGHVLYIRSGIIGSPRGYQIVKVSAHELEVSEASPFTAASDEATKNKIVYSIGWLSPGFEEIPLTIGPSVFQKTAAPSTDPLYTNILYGTSRTLQHSGRIVLNGRPVQDITFVEVTNPPATLTDLIDTSSNTIVFNNRVNGPPNNTESTLAADTEYQFSVHNPEKSQSMAAVNIVEVGSIFDGLNLRVVYKTLQIFADIHAYAINRNQRVSGAGHLIRARHPVWINMSIPYRLKATATGSLDEKAAAVAMAAHINSFDPNDDLDVSDISTALRVAYPIIGAVYPFEIEYRLNSPDGQQVLFSTSDIVSIFMSSTNGVELQNSGDLTPPQDLIDRGITQIITAADLMDWFDYAGISDRTVHYRTSEALIQFELKG